jgi:bifunctional DNase/RNase
MHGMEQKVELNIVGLSYSQTQSGAYALVLEDSTRKRRLPIIIGNFEAQAIAVVMEGLTPARPLTHDAFANVLKDFDVQLVEVIIYNLVEGIYYAKLICDNGFKQLEIDVRSSDAIALALRFQCPIFTYDFILNQAGISVEEERAADQHSDDEDEDDFEEPAPEVQKSIEELEKELNEAIENEDYERASQLRDEINKRK